jgi:circadian clock protein KaiC
MEDHGMGLKVSQQIERIPTGIEGLDTNLHGGLPQGSITLVSGTPGTGKTIVCFQYIFTGLKQNEKCLYLASDERVGNLLRQAKELGFDFQPYIEEGLLTFKYLDLDRGDIHRDIEEDVRTGGYQRVVLDSLTPVSEMPVWMVNKGSEIIPSKDAFTSSSFPLGSLEATRIHVRRLMSILSNDMTTTLVTSEIPEGSRTLSRDSISEFLADGILILDLDTTMDRRKLTVRKMRGTRHSLKPRDIQIGFGGIKLL